MSRRPTLRIVLVEDNDTYRATLELLLGMRDDLDVVASIGSGNEAAAVCVSVRPDVVLIDYRMPGPNGAETARAVLEACPDVAVICLTASVSRKEVDELTAAGVATVLKKDVEFDQLLATIRETANG